MSKIEEKNKVGRPKLADKTLIKKSYIYLSVAFLLVALIATSGVMLLFKNNSVRELKASASSKPFIPPLIGQGITTAYGKRGPMWSKGYHTGVDYGGGTNGMNIYPIASGVVYCISCKGSPFGNHVVIKHANNYYSLYAHMRSKPKVKKGQKVNIATKLGKVGATGNVTGPHLHLELWKGNPWSGGKDLNPANYVDSSKSGPGRCFIKTNSVKHEGTYTVSYSYSCTNTARVRAIYYSKMGKTVTKTKSSFSSKFQKSIKVKRENVDSHFKVTIKYYSNPRKSKKLTTISSTQSIKAVKNETNTTKKTAVKTPHKTSASNSGGTGTCKFTSLTAKEDSLSYKLSCTENTKINKIVYKMGAETFNADTTSLSGTIKTEESNTNRNTYLVAYYNGKVTKSKMILSKKTSNFKHVDKINTYCALTLANSSSYNATVRVNCGNNATPIKVSLVDEKITKELTIYRDGLFESPRYGYTGNFTFNNLSENKIYYSRVVYRFKDEGKTKLDVKYIKFKTLN